MESKDRYTNMVLKYEINDRLDEINLYVNELLSRNYVSFIDVTQIASFFKSNVDKLYENYNQDDIDTIRYYTGNAFKEVNAILRDNWNYEVNGLLTDEKKMNYRNLSSDIGRIIQSKGTELVDNIIVYRGVSLSTFKKFGVHSISELESLHEQYIYDSGFVSTSLIRDKSFFDRPLEYHEHCDIEIQYLIPGECTDGVPLITADLSYNNQEQVEYLINSGNLSKVIDVKFNDDKSKAFIVMVYIPKVVWDKNYQRQLDVKNFS